MLRHASNLNNMGIRARCFHSLGHATKTCAFCHCKVAQEVNGSKLNSNRGPDDLCMLSVMFTTLAEISQAKSEQNKACAQEGDQTQ